MDAVYFLHLFLFRRDVEGLGGFRRSALLRGLLGSGGRSRSALVIFQRLRHPALNLLDTGGIRGVIAQELRPLVVGSCCHTLPEAHSHLGIIACHGGKDQSHVISLTLI